MSHSTETFRRGTFPCFEKFRVSKNFMPKRGISGFSKEIFLSHSTETFRRGIFLRFKKFLVSKSFMDTGGGRGIITSFCRNFFISQYREASLGNPSMLCFRKSPVAREFIDNRGISRFSVEKLLSHSAEETS